MISDELHDQAALYALDLLAGDERAAFERELSASAELRDAVRDLREAAADVAIDIPQRMPSAALKQRVLREVALEKQRGVADESARTGGSTWLPWAIAAALAIFCGILFADRARVRRELASTQSETSRVQSELAQAQSETSRVQRELADARAKDPLQTTAVYALAPSGPAPAEAKATVAWDPETQTGVIRIAKLPPPGPGRDYQLWAVDAAHKDPVSAGIVKVNPDGSAEIRFKPVDVAQQVKAFAISLEREGGVPKAEGPILLVGTG